MNDNKKITNILFKLLAIYSRSLKRIKLKYFLLYYEKAVLKKYYKYKKLNNIFKKKAFIHKKSSFNNKKYNYEPLIGSARTSYSYLLNKSEPFILAPKINREMAYLMTPCYLIHNDEINDNNIRQYNRKFNKNIIQGYNWLFPKSKIHSYKILNSEFPLEPQHFNIKNSKNKMKNFSDLDTISISPLDNYNNLFDNYTKSNGKRLYKNIKKPYYSYRDSVNRSRNKNFIDKDFFHKYAKTNFEKKIYDKYNESKSHSQIFNMNDNDFTLGDENNKGKTIKKNHSRNRNDKINGYNPFVSKTNNLQPHVNRGILNHLYENNYLNKNKIKKNDNKINSKKKNNTNNIKNGKNNKNASNNKNKKALGISSEVKPNLKYSIFNSNKNDTNKSKDYLFPNSRNNNPYNKIFDKEMISYSISSATISGKNVNPLEKDTIKRNSNNTINYISNSASQTNNPGANRTSTNYSIGQGRNSHFSSNKDLQKKINNSVNKNNNNNYSKNENNKKVVIPYEISSGIVDEYFGDSIDKNTNSSNSNKISLQSLSDSKMIELADHYKLADDSSSDYRMNNIIHNKKEYIKNSEKLLNTKIGNKKKN